jgi:protein-arginine kinase activator protein McsA
VSADIHRKVNPRAKLKTLPEEIQERLFEQVESTTLEAALEYVRDELKITIGKTALADWAAWYRRREWIKEAESDASEMEDMLKRSGLQLGPEAISAIANAVFLNRASKLGDAKTFVATASVIQRSQELQNNQAAHKDKMEVAHLKLDLQTRDMERKMKELEMKLADYEKEKAAASKVLDVAAEKGASPQLIENVRAALNFRPVSPPSTPQTAAVAA